MFWCLLNLIILIIKNKFYCPSHGRKNPYCNYIMVQSQTKSIDHGFIPIFFLVNIFCEFVSIIYPRNTLIWSKYEYGRSIFDWKIDPLHECLVQIFFKDFVQFYISEKKVIHQFLHYVAATTFFCTSAKYNVSSRSTFNIALKTLEKSTHFMLTHVQ